jgi:hypothetical protein
MGGGGFLGLGPAPKAPPPPDYAGAARETAAGNLEAAQAATAANRVNQITPYGNLNYAETGTDSRGNPIWTATTTLSPAQQQLLDMQNQASAGLGSAITSQLGQVQDVMGRGFNPNTPAIQYGGQGPQFQNLQSANPLARAGTTADLQRSLGQNVGMEGWDRASNLLMQRLDPQLERQQERQDAQLAAQGIPIGSQAYTRAKQDLGQQQNDARIQAQLQAQGIQQNLFGQELQAGQFGNQATTQQQQNLLQNLGFSNQAQQQDFANRQAQLAFNNQLGQQGFQNQLAGANLSNQAQQQAYNQALTQYNMPLNTLSALRTGAQVQNPSFINAPQQATTSGADILGASQMGYNAQMGDFNAQQAAQQNFNQGLMGLGGAGIMKYSDIRMKENINLIGTLPNGLPFYNFEYKPEFKDIAGHGVHIGVMAQEVEMVKPKAVITNADGYKMVNYGMLNE